MKQERAKKKSGENGFGFGRHVSLKQNQHQHVFVGVIFAYLELLRFFCKLGLLLQVGVTFANTCCLNISCTCNCLFVLSEGKSKKQHMWSQ